MLQNPSKYHPNPLSHFLALHNSQAAHNAAAHNGAGLPGITGGHHPYQQEQLPPHQLPHQGSLTHHQQHDHLHHHHHRQHSHLMDANTSLDAGKSFTIAAILGLQKSAIESNRGKDYNNVINLSLNNNNNSNSNNNSNNNNNNNHHQLTQQHLRSTENCLPKLITGTNNNNTSPSRTSALSNFNCDTNASLNTIGGNASLVSRYLPSANGNSAATSFVGGQHQQQHQHQHQHQQQSANAAAQLRVNSFAAAAAVAAAAAANATGGAPTALQSLQQLHQHHAQQSSLSFQREKMKDNHGKKSSLKNKRVRTIFTPEQLERLEAEFERQQYMVGPERLYLAHTLQLTEAQVKVWFQNRRIKWRKHHLEITQQRLALLRQSQMSTSASGPNRSATPTGDEADDLKTSESLQEMGESRQASESDLSICNDSNDADSFVEGDET